MIFLHGTTDKLEIVRSSAATIDCVSSFVDASNTTGDTVALNNEPHAFSSAATSDLVSVLGNSANARNVKQITIRNKDVALSVDVTVQLNVSSTVYELHKATLMPGDMLEYIEGIGFFTVTSASLLDVMRYVTSNSVHVTAATFADVTGLGGIPVKAGHRYTFDCKLAAITNATTTGAQFGIGGVAMTDMIAMGRSTLLGSPTAASTNTTGVVTAIDTAVMAQTTGAATNQPHEMSGSFQPSVDGNFAIRATSEVTVAAGLTILKGSWCHVRESNN